jgi:hypothetical protein
MTVRSHLSSQLLCVGLLLCPGAAYAQGACPAGRAADGACVPQSLFSDMRDTNTVFSQPKISDTAYPLLPSSDWTNRYPNQLANTPSRISSTGRRIR